MRSNRANRCASTDRQRILPKPNNAASGWRRCSIRARSKAAAKRGGDWRRVTLSVAAADVPAEEVDFLTFEDLLQRLAAVDPRQAQIVELRFLGGLSNEDIAAHLSISLSTVESDWRHARAWLKRRLEGH